jgi:plastocyanin
MRRLAVGLMLLAGCTKETPKKAEPVAPVYFHVDAGTAGAFRGVVKFAGKKPARRMIDMSGDPACVEAHHGKAYEEPVLTDTKGGLENVFIYVKSGLEGKNFEAPATPVTIDQNGCWFHPRVMGIQVGQTLAVTNSDPVTHNIHPMAQINREWNHSQGMGDAPLARKFLKPEVMIRVKCNIHSWMHAFIGVVDNPYFAVTGADGKFEIKNLPPGDYVISAWHETLGTQEQKITIPPSGQIETNFSFKGE